MDTNLVSCSKDEAASDQDGQEEEKEGEEEKKGRR